MDGTWTIEPETKATKRIKLKESSDERAVEELQIPISVDDIINLPMRDLNAIKPILTKEQTEVVRDIRSRGKARNRAAGNRK